MSFNRFVFRLIPLFAAVGIVSACSSNLTPLPPVTDNTYHLGSGDEVRIIVFGEDKLTAQFKISDKGTIAMPLLGTVQAVGLTTDELASNISSGFEQKKLLRNASVAVEVQNYRPIFVLGEVARPGQYPYMPGMTVAQAAAMAGGYTYRAVTTQADVVRSQGSTKALEGTAYRNSVILPGDVISIDERLF